MINVLPCVYRIWNNITNKFYIGSAINYKQRWKNHCNALNNNAHRNINLQNEWNRYGSETFSFEILEFYYNKDIMLEREQYYINLALLINKNNLYNINLITKFGGFHNRKHTKETKDKMSKKRIGVSLTKGEKNPNSKLTLNEVSEIRNLYLNGNYTFADLGRKFNVTYQTISGIIKNKFWKI